MFLKKKPEGHMPRKLDEYKSYGQKLISLFARLLFTGEKYSLTQLAGFLDCSKQTVLRLLDDIARSYRVEIEDFREGNRKFVRIKKPGKLSPLAPMTKRELAVLQMCRAFTEHLLGKQQLEDATLALHKSKALLPAEAIPLADLFGDIRCGTIDYTPFQEAIHTLIEAMQRKRVCVVTYQAIREREPKVLYIKPLKIFSHHDTMYLHARLAKTPGKPYKEPKFDPLLPVHRMKQVEMTGTHFEFPADYNFEKAFNREFGIIKEQAFEVEAVFSGWSARYVAERVWSPDQKIEFLGEEKIKLTFQASSKPEVLSWLLSYGDEVELVRPEHLVQELALTVGRMQKMYGAGEERTGGSPGSSESPQ
jgi:predicted DNA-binding transcriptional regulator YafY